MTRLRAEMRDIHHGGGIIGPYVQDIPRLQRLKPFSGLEDGKWAKQPCRIYIVGHSHDLGVIFHSVHSLVT